MNTICNTNEITKVKRKQKDGTSIDVSAPTAVKVYNDNMSEVDLADQMQKAYTCTRKLVYATVLVLIRLKFCKCLCFRV